MPLKDFVPTDVNRVPVTGDAPKTLPIGYLSDWRLIQVRQHASGYLLNGAPVIAMQANDVVAMIDELTELRAAAGKRVSNFRPRGAVAKKKKGRSRR